MLLKAINEMLLAIDEFNAGKADDGLICIRFKNYLPGDPYVEVQLTEAGFLEFFHDEDYDLEDVDETFVKYKLSKGVIKYIALGYKNYEAFMGRS